MNKLNLLLLFICFFLNVSSMHVKGSKLLTSKGKEFMFRGVNLPHAWFTDKTQYSINEISSLGANSARIVLASGNKYPKTTYAQLEKIISWCRSAKLICVLELHDFTGSDNASDITRNAVNYWKEMKNLLNKNKDYVIVNIANEWLGTWNKGTLWRDTYSTAVKSMRSMGIQNALMVDASGWGQESGPMISYATKVLSADPNKNVIFSFHVYAVLGKDDKTLKSAFDSMKKTGVCWIVGEFGWKHSGQNVAYKYLMNYCQSNKIGWIAWSWAGNGGSDAPLDLTSAKTFSRKDLSEWGKYVFNGSGGIKSTSQKAY